MRIGSGRGGDRTTRCLKRPVKHGNAVKQEKTLPSGQNCWTEASRHVYDSERSRNGERSVMSDVFANPAVRAGAAVVVLCVLIAGGFYLLSIFRDYAAQDRETSNDVLSNLREMNRRGDISDEEFRTIQATAERRLPPAVDNDDNASPDSESI